LRKALVSFQKAIDEDPQYALAYAGLADVYSMLGDFTGRPDAYHHQAEAAAKRALELDGRIAEAYASLAYLELRTWNWAHVEPRFKRAFELNPSYATAHQWYSIYLELMGRTDEAIREAERARELDPLSPIIHESLASRLHFARRPDRALTVLRRTIEIEPSFQAAREALVQVQVEQGRYEDAFRELARTRAAGDRPMTAALAYALARAGRDREAREVLERLKGVDLVESARIHEALGEHEVALDLLEQALKEHLDHLVFIKVDPSWDDLRAHPRFVTLLQAMRLAPFERGFSQSS
jgi:Tfp pilus assembly protein PilF